MSDDFLKALREEPRPELVQDLRERLRKQERAAEPAVASAAPLVARRPRPRAPFLGLAAAASVTALLAVPSVRVAAQGFLDIFRVKHIAAVPTDLARLKRLDESLDMKTFAGDQIETLVEAGPLQAVDSVGAASDLAGLTLRVPATLPPGFTGPAVRYRPRGAYRVTADMNKVETVLKTLDIDDVAVPWEANGAVFTVNTPPVVELTYERGGGEMRLIQAESPAIDLPPGLDLARLGEIVLRVYGLSATEARSFARTVDWSSTMLVPVPVLGNQYREVDVNGAKGVLITAERTTRADGSVRPRRSCLVWSADGRLYRLSGGGNGVELLQVAQSLR